MIYGMDKMKSQYKYLNWDNGAVLSFDLYTNNLKKYYSSNSFQNAYRDIKNFLLKNGFEHLKDSDYLNKNIDDVQTAKIMRNFGIKNKWFPACINKLNISPNVEKLDISDNIKNLVDLDWLKEKDLENLTSYEKKDIDISNFFINTIDDLEDELER